MKNGKRILNVTIKKMIDESPDTSFLGEYSNRATSEFSIDRKHSLDCASQTYNVTVASIRTLKHAITYLNDTYLHGQWPSDTPYVSDCADAVEVLGDSLDAIAECDCGERGDMERNEYRYFNPSFNYVDKDGKAKPENTPEEVQKYTRQDYERMESLNAGQWCYLGIRADAQIQLTKEGPLQDMTSGGLWGVESDAGREHTEEIEGEQLTELRGQLLALGFSRRAIASAFKNVERNNS